LILIMDPIADVVCAFCGSLMDLQRDLPSTTDSHELRFFSCTGCGAGEWRVIEAADENPGPAKSE